MFLVFNTKFETAIVKQARTQLLRKIKLWKIKNAGETEEFEDYNSRHYDEDEKPVHKKLQKAIRAGSPWKEYFEKILRRTEEINDNKKSETLKSQKLNLFYSEVLSNYLLRHWLSLFPLWCMAVSNLFGVQNLKSCFSNSHVENWFSSVKSAHLRNSSSGVRIRVTKFIKTQREFIMKRLVRWKLADSRPKRKYSRGNKIHEAEEIWGKKRAKYVKPTSATIEKLFKNHRPQVVHLIVSKVK